MLRAGGDPETRKQLIEAGIEPTHLPTERFSSMMASDLGRFAKIVEKAGIAIEQ